MTLKRNNLFPLSETTPLLRLAVWFILGIVTGFYGSVTVSLFLSALAVATLVALLLWRKPLVQSLLIALAMFLLGATLAARQRDRLAARDMTLRQWQWSQRTPDADTPLGRSRLFFLQQRERLLNRYHRQGLQGEAYAVVAAMTLGDRSAIDPALRQSYNVSGAAHVLALSGLHMGIIYGLLSLLAFGRRRRVLVQSLIVVALWLFVFLVGMPASAVRAATMLSLYALLSLGYRERASINALAFTAIVMLVISPLMLFDVGFQMSFLAVLSILVWTPVMLRWLPERLQQRSRLVRWLWGLTVVTLAAQLGVAPLIAYYFGRFSTWFLLTAFLVIPVVTVILWLALAVLLVSALSPVLTALVTTLNSGLALIARLPGASIEGLHPSLLQVLLVYLLILCFYWLTVLLAPARGFPDRSSGIG